MKTQSYNWIATNNEIKNELRLHRRYVFPDRELAKAFIGETGQYMSSPNISVMLEAGGKQNEVEAFIQTRRDEFLLESAKIIMFEIDYMYVTFSNPATEATA